MKSLINPISKEVINWQSKFSENIKVKNVGKATYVDHDPFHLSINHSHKDH